MVEQIDTTLMKVEPQRDIELMNFYREAVRLKEYAEVRIIATANDLAPATNDLSIIAHLKKAMEIKRKDYLQPFQDHIKETNGTFKTLMEPIETADQVTRNKILAFQAEQETKRKMQEELNRLKMDISRKEMELKGELTDSVNLVEVMPELARKTVTELGSATTIKVRKWEVADFALLPDRFKMENAALIGRVVRAGEQEIPGVRIWVEDSLRITAR